MVRDCIERAVLDNAGAMDGSRPLEIIADACGYGWEGVRLHMKSDLAGFNELTIVWGDVAED